MLKQYHAKQILNIALAGHSSSGKTTVAEAMLFLSGGLERLGRVSEGTATLDFDPEEIKRKTSVTTAVAPVEWKNYKINLIDTPGLFDFEGSVCEAVRAADTMLIAVSAKSGVSVGTEKAVAAASQNDLAKVFFVNGLCDESADFYKVFQDLKTYFGPAVCPLVVPFIVDGKVDCYINLLEYKAHRYENGVMKDVPMPDMGTRLDGLRTAIYEAVAETSDEMFEKYFSGEKFTPEEVILGISKGVKEGKIYPVFCGDAQLTDGVDQLLNGLIWLAPTVADYGSEIGVDIEGNPVEIAVNEDAATAAIVFKTVVDPFIGKLTFVKVVAGKLTADSPVMNMRTGEQERMIKMYYMCGKKQEETKCICAGDIGAIPKLQHTNTGDTLCSPTRKVVLEGVTYPEPVLSMAILPKQKGEEDKVAQGILRLLEEDPTLKFVNNAETHQMILFGLGEQHLDVVVSKLKGKFGLDVTLEKPKVAYRETIRKKVQAQGKHKKQTGGHGQFGDVWIEFEPSDSEGLEFEERVVGGAVPKGFFPAVEKGLRESMQKGVLAGYAVVGLKATLYDGSYHPVDSSEMAFKMAAAAAYKAGMPNASPVLLEPVGNLMATVPDENMGDVMGEINKRRGRVLGMHPANAGYQTINAEVPVAEMHDFSTYIRQNTHGRGNYLFSFVKYEEVPTHIVQNILKENQDKE